MHVHIAPVGTTVPPVEKVLNKIGGIDRLYLLYTVPNKKNDEDHKSKYLENMDGTTNVSDSNMPKGINGTKNYEDKGAKNNDREVKKGMTSYEVMEKIRSDYSLGIGADNIIPVQTDMFDFRKNVNIIFDIYTKEKGKGVTFSINITGGTKIMACAACYSSYYIGAAMYHADVPENPIEPPKSVDYDKYKKITKDILKFINEKSKDDTYIITNQVISDNLYKNKKLDKNVVAYHLNRKLIPDGLVRIDKTHSNKRENRLKITENGSMIASYL